MKDFFISYNQADKQWAEWIAWELEEADYSVIIQAWDFRPGGNFGLDMQRAVQESNRTIAVLSESYLKSSFTQPEWTAAFVQDPESLKRKLIPVRVKDCKPGGLLSSIVYVDLVGLTEADAKRALLDSLRERAKPAQAPIFPGVRSTERVIETPKAFPGVTKQAKENFLPQSIESLESDLDCQQLIEHLNDCDWKLLKRAYEHCRPRDWNSKQPENLVEVVTDLYRYYEKNKNNDENILINFLVYLITKPELSDNLIVDLKGWANKAFGVKEEEIAEQCDRLKESLTAKQISETANIESRLWIILNEAGTSDQYKLESAYYIKNIHNYQRDNKDSYQKIEFELSENVKRSQLQDRDFCFPGLTEIIEQIYVDDTLRIDFFLPFKSLDLIVDSWLIQDEYGDEPFPIGSEYPVVIRVLERHNKAYKQAPLWKSNWKPQYINQLSKSALICSDRPLDKISEELVKEEVLGLRCKCPIETHKTHKKKLKPMIMRRGLPIALWLRKELKNCCGEENYHELLDINLVELPQKLKNIRNEDRQNESHLAHHISLLWDDPINLPSDDYKFQMPKSGL